MVRCITSSGYPKSRKHRDSDMPHSYRGRTPSPSSQCRRVIPPQSKDYSRALLGEEDDDDEVPYEQSRSEILDRNRKSYTLPMRQQLAVYDDTHLLDYEIPQDYIQEQDPYGVKKEKVRHRSKDAEQADWYYNRVAGRPTRPGLASRGRHYDYYYYIDEDNDNTNNNKVTYHHDPRRYDYHHHHSHGISPSTSTRRSQSAVDDASDDYYLKSYFRNFKPSPTTGRRYDADDDYRYENDRYGNGGRQHDNYDQPRGRNHGYQQQQQQGGDRQWKSGYKPASARTSRGEYGYYDNNGGQYAYDDRVDYDAVKRRNYQYPASKASLPPRSGSRVSQYESSAPPPRAGSRSSHLYDQQDYDPPTRRGSLASQYQDDQISRSGSQYDLPTRAGSRSSNYDVQQDSSRASPAFHRQTSRSSIHYERGIPEEASGDLYESEEAQDIESRQEDYQDKISFQDVGPVDETYDKEHEIMELLKQGKSIDQIVPDPGMKSFYVYKTRGPDKLEIFDRPDEVIEYDPELHYRAPTCDIKLRSHTVWEKMYVKFTCTVKGRPLPKVIWYKNMIPIQPMISDAGHIKITSQYGVHTLEIYRACLDDSGTYRISAQNCKGEVSSFATLAVKRYQPGRMGFHNTPFTMSKSFGEKLRFITGLWNKYANEGESINLSCHVDGKLPLDVVWSLNGRELKNSDRINISFDKNVCNLSISRTTPDDEGEYRCHVSNKYHFVSSRAFVFVHGTDASPSAPTNMQVDDVTSDYVTLSWDPAGYEGHFGGSPVEGYLIEGSAKNSKIWRKLNVLPVKLTTTNLNLSGNYSNFRVRAVNRWGVSHPSLPVEGVKMRRRKRTDDEAISSDSSKLEAKINKDENYFSLSWNLTTAEVESFSHLRIEYCHDDGSGDVEETWERTEVKLPPGSSSYPLENRKFTEHQNLKFRIVGVTELDGDEEGDEGEDSNKIIITSTSTAVTSSSTGETTEGCGDDGVAADDVTNVLSCPTTISCLNTSRDQIEIGWLPPHGDVTIDELSYLVEYRKVDDVDGWMFANQQPIRFTRFPIGPLAGGEFYEFRVRAIDSRSHTTSKFSEISQPFQATDFHEQPRWEGEKLEDIFRVAINKHGKDMISGTSIKLCWESPTYEGGSPVKGYQLEYKTANSSCYQQLNNKPIRARYFNCENLKENQFYDFRVRSCNTSGWGDWIQLKSPIFTRDISYPPRDVIVTKCDEDSVQLKWNKPEMACGDDVTIRYIVERKKGGSADDMWIPCNGEAEAMTSYNVGGLLEGDIYSFRVKSIFVNSGEMFISEPTTFTTVARQEMAEEEDGEDKKQPEEQDIQEQLQEETEERVEIVEKEEQLEEVEQSQEQIQIEEEKIPINEEDLQKEEKETESETLIENEEEIKQEVELVLEQVLEKEEEQPEIQKLETKLEELNDEEKEITEKKEEVVKGVFASRLTDYIKPKKSNEPITFSCSVNHSSVNVSWFYANQKIVEDSDKFQISTRDCERSLTINDCDVTTDQHVMCVTMDNNDATSVQILIEKEESPHPDYLINFEQALEPEVTSQQVRLFCVVTSLKDDTKIIWYRDNQVIDTNGGDSNYKSTNDFVNGVVSLVISPPSSDVMEGKFTCEFISPQKTFDTKVNFEFTPKIVADLMSGYEKLKVEVKKKFPKKTVKFADEDKNEMKIYLKDIYGPLQVDCEEIKEESLEREEEEFQEEEKQVHEKEEEEESLEREEEEFQKEEKQVHEKEEEQQPKE